MEKDEISKVCDFLDKLPVFCEKYKESYGQPLFPNKARKGILSFLWKSNGNGQQEESMEEKIKQLKKLLSEGDIPQALEIVEYFIKLCESQPRYRFNHYEYIWKLLGVPWVKVRMIELRNILLNM